MIKAVTATTAGFAVMLACGMPATAAEVTALVSNALKTTLPELAPAFEKTTGHTLKVTFGSTEPLRARIEKGEAVDLTVIGESAIDQLITQGKLVAATRTAVTRSGLGVAIRKGTPKPDLGTTEGFKRTLLAAKSISFNERGLTGIYLWDLFQRLGITAEIKAKYKDGSGAAMVSKGEADIGLTQASEVALVDGVELGGLVPPEIQNYTLFPGAVVTIAKQPGAAKALLEFLLSSDSARVMKAKGLYPSS